MEVKYWYDLPEQTFKILACQELKHGIIEMLKNPISCINTRDYVTVGIL